MQTLQRNLSRMFGTGKEARQPDYEGAARRRFKKLAVERGFTFTKSRDGYLEIPVCDTFPAGLVTAFHGWPDALDRVEHCIADPAAAEDGSYSA